MPSTPSPTELLPKLRAHYPSINFVEDSLFLWSPETQSVHFDLSQPHAAALLLHELSHGILRHHSYTRDVELLTMEMAAWEQAKQLAKQYDFSLRDTIAEDNLDTYREWLHSRSTCPACTATGYQVSSSLYECPACTHRWRVNEARSCALRRYNLI